MNKTHSCVRSMSCEAGKVQRGGGAGRQLPLPGREEAKRGRDLDTLDTSEAGEASQITGNGGMSTLGQIFDITNGSRNAGSRVKILLFHPLPMMDPFHCQSNTSQSADHESAPHVPRSRTPLVTFAGQ